MPPPPHTAKIYTNCAAMHLDWLHCVGRPGAVDHTSDTQFYVRSALYYASTKSDRDKDGIACEA